MSRLLGTLTILSALAACASTPARPRRAPRRPRPSPRRPRRPRRPCPRHAPPVAAAGPAVSGYDQPPQNVLDVLHAPSPPQPLREPDARHGSCSCRGCSIRRSRRSPSRSCKLAGVRVEPRTRRKHDTPGGYGVAPCARTFALVDVATGARDAGRRCRRAAAPTASSWAADGKRFAFRNTSADAVELWVGDAATGAIAAARRRAAEPDARQLAAVDARPEDAAREARARRTPGRRRAASVVAERPEHPGDRRRDGREQHLRDARHARRASTTRISSTTTGPASSPSSTRDRERSRRVGKPGDPHRGRRRARRRAHPRRPRSSKPYSYVTTYDRFAHDVEVWDRTGTLDRHARAAAGRGPRPDRTACRPARATSSGARPSRRRSSGPRRSTAATGTSKVPARDKVMMQSAPFTDAADRDRAHRAALRRLRLERAAASVAPAPRVRREPPLAAHVRRRRRRPEAEAAPRSGTCRATSATRIPGQPVYRVLPNGQWVVRAGRRRDLPARRRARRPTAIARSSIASISKTRKSERLFRSDKTALEYFLAFADGDRPRVPHLAPVADRSAERDAAHARRAACQRAGRARPRSRRRRARSRTSPIRRPRCARSRSGSSSTSARTARELSFTLLHAARTTRRARASRRSSTPIRSTTPSAATAGQVTGSEQMLHAARATTACCCSPATRSSTTPRSRSSAIRRRPTTPTSSSSSTTRRRRSTRRSSSASSIAIASASPATATAR